jgi:hypothetical protein
MEEVTKKHLWEVDHPYYCAMGNYFSNDAYLEFSTWSAFLEEFGKADFAMNLLFRFDWNLDENPSEDMYYRDGVLNIYWMAQRKGRNFSSHVRVCKADESKVIEFLKPRWEYMKKLWEGISDFNSSSSETKVK